MNIFPVEAGGMNISPDFDAEAQLTPCRSTHKHAMRLFPPVWTQNMFFPIRKGIAEALLELSDLRIKMQASDTYLGHFVYHLEDRLRNKIKNLKVAWSGKVTDEGCQRTPQPTVRSTPDLRKRPREPTVSPEETAAEKPENKRLWASIKEEEWVEVSVRKNLLKRKKKNVFKTLVKPRRARPEAMLIKPAEEVSRAAILKDLKKRVKPNELGDIVQGIRKKRFKDLLAEFECSKDDRERLDSALKEVTSASGYVRHLTPKNKVEIADNDPGIETEDVEEAVRGCFDHESVPDKKVSKRLRDP